MSRNGLIYCFDARNIKSYPGTGTTLYDVSGNNVSHSSNSVYNAAGYMNYTADADGLTVPGPFAPWEHTIECVYRATSPGTGCCDTVFGTYWFRFFLINSSIYTMIGFANADGTYKQYQHPAFDAPTGSWHHVIGMRRNDRYIIWLNGVERYNTNYGTGDPLFSNSGSYVISGGQHANIDIAIARTYNRGLTNTEILNNYSGLKDRYGF
jgi:hypothetical protein